VRTPVVNDSICCDSHAGVASGSDISYGLDREGTTLDGVNKARVEFILLSLVAQAAVISKSPCEDASRCLLFPFSFYNYGVILPASDAAKANIFRVVEGDTLHISPVIKMKKRVRTTTRFSFGGRTRSFSFLPVLFLLFFEDFASRQLALVFILDFSSLFDMLPLVTISKLTIHR